MESIARADPRTSARARLVSGIEKSDLPQYVYSYPSKRAYRHLAPNRTIERLWQNCPQTLNLYVHIPFCRYRCGFCTLFLLTAPADDVVQKYISALKRQIEMYGRLLGSAQIVSLYIGGGTPTLLPSSVFDDLFHTLRTAFPRWKDSAEISVEGTPETMQPELLRSLKDWSVNRISMGLQTLNDDERRAIGRQHNRETVDAAVRAIDCVGFDNVNYDLIYGLEGQTFESWLHSLRTTVEFCPCTITIYPVIFRKLATIAKRKEQWAARFPTNISKYAFYDKSVDFLLEHRFKQNTFVRFSTCQDDGLKQEVADFSGVPLLGLGAGSRSYNDAVHYGTDFAVHRDRSNAIIHEFTQCEHRPDRVPDVGFIMDDDERRRRFCILNLSLGQVESAAYSTRFGRRIQDDFGEELDALQSEGCVRFEETGVYSLTRKGFRHSNIIATLFQSQRVTDLEQQYHPV